MKKPLTQQTPSDNTVDAQKSVQSSVQGSAVQLVHFLNDLPKPYLSLLSEYLDVDALSKAMMVDTVTNSRFQLWVMLIWRNRLRDEFFIPLQVSQKFQSAHLVYRRLRNLANNPCEDPNTLYRKIRFSLCDPEQNLFATSWLYFPFVPSLRDQCIAELKKDGAIFREYYLDLACQVGNLAFVRFMVEEFGLKLTTVRLKYAFRSGNIELIQYFDQCGLAPNSVGLYYAEESGNQTFVQYLIDSFGLYPSDTFLDRAAESGSLQLVNYYRKTYLRVPTVDTFKAALRSGNVALLKDLPYDLTSDSIDDDLRSHTISLELVQYLIYEKDYSPTPQTLNKALEKGDYGLVDLLMKKYKLVGEFRRSAISGDIEFVKKVVVRCDEIPDISWLRCAVFSGNVNLVKYLSAEYHLDSREIIFDDLRQNGTNLGDYYEFCFSHLPMLKFLIEEQGCVPHKRRFTDYIAYRNPNLPVAYYLITECGFSLGEIWHREPNQLYPLAVQRQHQQQHSKNPLLYVFKMKKSYRFDWLSTEFNLNLAGKNIIAAMSLFIRDRLRHHTYLEISPPCSQENAVVLLTQLKTVIDEKRGTKKILIPFAIGRRSEHWQLLILDLITQSAKVINSRNLMVFRRDDARRQHEDEWDYGDINNYEVLSEEEVIGSHYNRFLACIREVFGDITEVTYCQRNTNNSQGFSAFATVMAMLDETHVMCSADVYYEEQRYTPLVYPLSHRAVLHWQAEVLGFLSLHLSQIPTLVTADGGNEIVNGENLQSALTTVLYERDGVTPKLITPIELQGVNHFDRGKAFLFIKEAFLETFEPDGFDYATNNLTPALSDTKDKYLKFPAHSLTLFMALTTLFGLPTRPEKASIDEGPILTWRQIVRNFFGGWNPIKRNDDTGEWNIKGKVLWNILFLPFKLVIFLLKLVMIPFKMVFNLVKLFTEFLPAVIQRYTNVWGDNLDERRSASVFRARHIFKVFPFLFYGVLGLLTRLIFALSLSWAVLGKLVTSPEKSVRLSWAIAEGAFSNKIAKAIIGTMLVAISVLMSGCLWMILGALIWVNIIPWVTAQIPMLVPMVTTFLNTPWVASTLMVIKSGIVSFFAMLPETLIPFAFLGLVIVPPAIVAITIRIAKELSNAWARWTATKPARKDDFIELEEMPAVSQEATQLVGHVDQSFEQAAANADQLHKAVDRLEEELILKPGAPTSPIAVADTHNNGIDLTL